MKVKAAITSTTGTTLPTRYTSQPPGSVASTSRTRSVRVTAAVIPRAENTRIGPTSSTLKYRLKRSPMLRGSAMCQM